MLLDLLFPRFCLQCRTFGSLICKNCRKNIHFLTVQEIQNIKTPEHIDRAVSFVRYNSIAKVIIKTIKYKLLFSLFDELLEIIPKNLVLDSFKDVELEKCVLQPIALHKNRYRQRGFNQAKQLANMFSTILHIPASDFLVRIVDTKPQALLNKKNRIENIKGAFTCKNKPLISQQNIILVDDVFTTGATANEAASVLKSNGAQSVFLLTLALD